MKKKILLLLMICVLVLGSTSLAFADTQMPIDDEAYSIVEVPVYDSIEDAEEAQETDSLKSENIQPRELGIVKLSFFVIRDGNKTDCVTHVRWSGTTAINGVRYKGLVVENSSSGKNYGKWLPKKGKYYRYHALHSSKAGTKSLWNVKIPKKIKKVRIKVNSPMVRQSSSNSWYSLPKINKVVIIN